jgi:flagellar L-ring protein precursor FlgH
MLIKKSEKSKVLVIIILNVISIFTFSQTSYSQFIQNSNRSLFSDVKANKIGDVVLIVVVEDTKANNTANTSSGRSSNVSGTLGIQSSVTNNTYGGSIGIGNDFKGSGNTDRSESIRTKLSAKVIEVDKNGNLKIQASRNTKINGEAQTITLEGLVRPTDLSTDNSVYSYNILDLKLTITGNGSVSEVQEPGLITKFLRFLF